LAASRTEFHNRVSPGEGAVRRGRKPSVLFSTDGDLLPGGMLLRWA
jgi:hypothetical protein